MSANRPLRAALLPLVPAAALTLGAAAPLLAWGFDGHRVVAEIAYQRLSATAREAVGELLALDSEYSTLAEAATWADTVTRSKAYSEEFHWINMIDSDTAADIAERCYKLGCASMAVAYYEEVLYSAAPGPARLEALKFLAHFVGDIHQPLHAGRASDIGGNKIKVRFYGRRVIPNPYPGAKKKYYNLHNVWDTHLIRKINDDWETGSWQAYAQRLAATIGDAQAEEWMASTVVDWTMESHEAAFRAVYADLPPGSQPVEIGADYVAANRARVETRLKQAGVRLAYLLELALGD